ncbi:MAG: hypothetical protein LBD58_04845 [Treponema sp.]|nr:hypothetical protein [Treponema sp.]
MTSFPLIIVFIITIIAMIFVISKLKVHPFSPVMAAPFIFGLMGVIPPVNINRDGVTLQGVA